MVLLAWDYISGISKSHCPEASLGKYIAGAPAESHAGPVSREGIPWWFESGTALGYSLSISPLCGAHMTMGQVGGDSCGSACGAGDREPRVQKKGQTSLF